MSDNDSPRLEDEPASSHNNLNETFHLIEKALEQVKSLFCNAFQGNLSPHELASGVLTLIDQMVQHRDGSGMVQCSIPADTPHLESMAWGLRGIVDNMAREDRRHHDTLVAFINSFFPLLRPRPWMLWGSSMEKSNLLLGATFRESYQGAGSEEATSSPSSTVLQELVQKSLSWINYCRFVARMTRDTDHDFSLYLLWFARDALEDCTWCSCTCPCAAIVAFEEVIDVCGVWMFHSDADFGSNGCGGDGVRKWEGKSGFCRERWLFWEGELHSITQDEDRYPPHVRDSARRTGATMELVQTESDCT